MRLMVYSGTLNKTLIAMMLAGLAGVLAVIAYAGTDASAFAGYGGRFDAIAGWIERTSLTRRPRRSASLGFKASPKRFWSAKRYRGRLHRGRRDGPGAILAAGLLACVVASEGSASRRPGASPFLLTPALQVRCNHRLAAVLPNLAPGNPKLMAAGDISPRPTRRRGPTAGQVLVVTSVMFTFISFWRTAAIVLCDLASTAYYIGGIVESQIGKAAPWFILAVMLFSYAVRSVYIESCSMFVRGGVYRVVKEAMGGVAGQAVGLGPDVRLHPDRPDQRRLGRPVHHRPAQRPVQLGRRQLARWPTRTGSRRRSPSAITLYFWRVNIQGIHESSDKALKIMGATTVMGVIMIVWCLADAGGATREPGTCPAARRPTCPAKVDPQGKPILDPFGKQVDPLGFLGRDAAGRRRLRPGA